MAGSTGFEPSTSGLTVQCANQAAPRARLETSARYTTLPSDASGRCALNCARQLPSDVLQVRRVHDVVAVEHRARPVPRHGHRHALRHAAVHHVPHRGSPEVMSQPPRHPGLPARREPALPEVQARLPRSLALAHMREHVGHDAREPAFQSLHALELAPQRALQLRRQIDDARVLILGHARIQAKGPRIELTLYTAGSRFFAARSTRRLRSVTNMLLVNTVKAPARALVMSEKARPKFSGPRAS